MFDKIVVNGFFGRHAGDVHSADNPDRAGNFIRYVIRAIFTDTKSGLSFLPSAVFFGLRRSEHSTGPMFRQTWCSLMSRRFPQAFLVFLKDLITVGVTLLFVWYGYGFFMFGFMGPLGTGIACPGQRSGRFALDLVPGIFLGLIFMAV
jgi:hypothetical protein